MGERMRNHYTKDFKFKVAIAAIKGEKPFSELTAEFKVHQTLISSLKRQPMEQGAGVFDTNLGKSNQEDATANEDLVKTIGHLTVQINWLKIKLRICESWRGGQ